MLGGILMWLKSPVQQVTEKFQLRCYFDLEIFLAWRLDGVMPQAFVVSLVKKERPGHLLYFIFLNEYHCPLLQSDASSGRPCDIYLPLEREIARSKQWLAAASVKYRASHRRDGPAFQLLLCSRIRLCKWSLH